jgi:transcriptional regulator with XRE-family HTH domain
MLNLIAVGEQVATHRKRLKLTQAELSRRAGISRATLDALENGRARELGFSNLTFALEGICNG